MMNGFESACALLEGGTELVGSTWSYTFGCPSVLFLYHNCVGKLDETLRSFEAGFPAWQKLSPLGRGADHLLRAEAHYERGRFLQAEQEGSRALFLAEQHAQSSVVMASKLLLIRVCAAQGRFSAADALYRELSGLVNYRKAPLYLSSLDMCRGIFCLLTGALEDVPTWLARGELYKSAVNRAGFGVEWLIYGEFLLAKRDYIRLQAVLPVMLEDFSRYNNLCGILRAQLMEAVAAFHLSGAQAASVPLVAALSAADADGLAMPVCELGEHLLPVFSALLPLCESGGCGICSARLSAASRAARAYQTALKRFRAGFAAAYPGHSIPAVRLTKRETEILRLIVKGKSSEEIARELFVTPINIRVITSKAYAKLGVSSRAEAVRAALENGLV